MKNKVSMRFLKQLFKTNKLKTKAIRVTKSRMLATMLLCLLGFNSFAVPAKPGLTRLLTLTDGTTVNATLVGDEFGHYWVDTEGHAYQVVTDFGDASPCSRVRLLV